MPLHLALVHHPVTDKRGDLVTTSVTNIDLHDIARSCRVFGVERYWVVTPVDAMWLLVQRIVRHWREGWGVGYNPGRGEALGTIELARTLQDAIAGCESATGARPLVVATSARGAASLPTLSIQALAAEARPVLLVFGTGNGLAPAALSLCDAILPPIEGAVDGYNHLSVRSAVAIYLRDLTREKARPKP